MFIEFDNEIVNLNYVVYLQKQTSQALLFETKEYYVTLHLNNGTECGETLVYSFDDEISQERVYREFRSKILSFNSK